MLPDILLDYKRYTSKQIIKAIEDHPLSYIYHHPVDAGVDKAEEYVYNSARDNYYGKNYGLLEVEFLE